MMLLAPARFSITMFCPKASEALGLIKRNVTSTGPPAGNGTINRIGFDG
jgi:hypothetical protein